MVEVASMETLKFLMITTHFPPFHLGGDAVLVDYLSRELARRGHEVHVLHNPTVYKMLRPASETGSSDDIDDGIRRHQYKPRLGKYQPWINLTLGLSGMPSRMASELAKTVKPDVAHWHNTRGFIGVPMQLRNEICLYTSHDYGAICPRSNLLKPNLEICSAARMCTACSLRWRKPPQLWRVMGGRVLELQDEIRIISPSQFVADRLSDEGLRVHKVLRNFVPDPGPINRERSAKRNALIYLGMLEIHKGLHTLVKAFIKSNDRQGFELDIIGEGSLRSELIEAITKAELQNRVHVHGFLERTEAEALRKSALAQIVPSEWLENCPLTILEAFAMGIPVIGSEMGGIPEIVGPDSGSIVFRAGDVDVLADTIVDLWQRREELAGLGKRARNAYETRFRPDIHMAEYLRIINGSI